jgi:heme/copper-type cytochrome/quinol oxidase subunit 3
MTLSPSTRHALDRVLLVLTAIAVLIPIITLAEKSAGPTAAPVWVTRLLCFGFVLARIIPWLKRQHAAHPNTVANLAALATFFGVVFALVHPAVYELALWIGRLALLFGLPAIVAWKLDPESARQIWRDYRSQYPRKHNAH